MAHIQIDDTTPRIAYTAIASQTLFVVPFTFFAEADLLVYVNDTLKTLTTDYTVAGEGDTGGGSITLVTASTVGDSVLIVRDIAIERTTDFPASGPFEIDDLNTELDKQVAMMQQILAAFPRALQQPTSDADDFDELPVAADRASTYLFFDSNGQPTVVASVSTSVAASAYILTLMTAASAAVARTTLGITDQSSYTGLANWHACR